MLTCATEIGLRRRSHQRGAINLRRFSVLLFVHNLLDSDKFVSARYLLGSDLGIRQTPRTVGITVSASLD